MDYADWNRGLLLGSLLVVMAVMALISGRCARDRLLSAGVLVQGIVMLVVAGAVYYPRAELGIGVVALLALLGLWSLWLIQDSRGNPAGSGPQPNGPVVGTMDISNQATSAATPEVEGVS